MHHLQLAPCDLESRYPGQTKQSLLGGTLALGWRSPTLKPSILGYVNSELFFRCHPLANHGAVSWH